MAMLNDLKKKPKKTQGNGSFNGDTTHLEMVLNRPRRLLRFSNTSMTRMAKELSKVGEMEGFRVNPGKSGKSPPVCE